MKAVVLVGGEGTRLRPLTETIPKPLLPLMDRASLDHVLDHLARHGVHEVVLSSPYLEETFRAFIDARHGDPAITWITETEPLGTGGAIVNALEALGGDEPFLALNGDILTDLDLTAMVAMHGDRGAAATIALTHVADARPYGLVPTEPDGRVLEFREKPAELVPGDVNAGTYVLDPGVLAGWARGVNASIERDIFPSLIADGRPVYGFVSDAYWIDLGTPESYLRAHFDILEGRVAFEPSYTAPFIAEGAEVDVRSHVGRWVVVSAAAVIGPDARVDDSVLHQGAVVETGASVTGSVLGARSRVGAGAVVVDSVLAEGATVPAGSKVEGARISAGRTAGSASGSA
jgi:mannose-1-phosphate guanylyltransferase